MITSYSDNKGPILYCSPGFLFDMDKREVVQEIEEMSVASDSNFFDVPSPQAEEATLSWRNDNK